MEQLLGWTKMDACSLNSAVTLVWWSIWKERDARVLNNLHSTPVAVFNKIAHDAAVWLFAERSLAGQLVHRPREPD
jgi:myo-inositol-hexaphosphate 3-phosphohydrolase